MVLLQAYFNFTLQFRVWRKSTQRVATRCIRPRWKGKKEFMFWGSFSYDEKGPFHIWKPETKKEKRAADVEIKRLNDRLEPVKRAEWEASYAIYRLGLRNKPGPRAQWRFNKDNGKLVRENEAGGIDWWLYQKHILHAKLIPFAQRCKITRPNTIVQEDKAPAHKHWAQAGVYDAAAIERLIWCGNSPDMNAIEPAWPYLKRETTKKGPPESRAVAERVWARAWKDMPQEKIQRWIKRIPYHVQQIINCKGGNEYIEGNEVIETRVIKRRKPINVS